MYPTADQVARAIVEASRICKINPLVVMRAPGEQAYSHETMKRARGYAALALRKAFPNCPSDALGRMVGASIRGSDYLGALVTGQRKGTLRWFDPLDLDAVVEAIGPVEFEPEIISISELDEPAPFRPARPAPSVPVSINSAPRCGAKKKLEDLLREAVLNTGGRIA